MTSQKKVNITTFARLLKIGHRSVQKALERGRLSYTTDEKGRVWIEKEVGLAQWHATLNKKASDIAKQKKGKKGKISKISKISKKSGKKKKSSAGNKKLPSYIAPPKLDQDGELTMAEAERREKVNRSKLSELKYLEQAGKLIDVEKVQRKAFEAARKTRDAIMNIPARYAHELAVETDPHKLEVFLKRILGQALEKRIRGAL